jgi:hypothetical protein
MSFMKTMKTILSHLIIKEWILKWIIQSLKEEECKKSYQGNKILFEMKINHIFTVQKKRTFKQSESAFSSRSHYFNFMTISSLLRWY